MRLEELADLRKQVDVADQDLVLGDFFNLDLDARQGCQVSIIMVCQKQNSHL
jgi:hypothetical protein